MRDYPLYHRPSVWTGAARVIDFFGSLQLTKGDLGVVYDARATYDDWRAVGEDLFGAVAQYSTKDDDQLKLFED